MINENKFTLDMQSEMSNFATNLQNLNQTLSPQLSNIDKINFDVIPQSNDFESAVFSDPITESLTKLNNNYESAVFSDPITESLTKLNNNYENASLNSIADISSEINFESQPIFDAANKNDLMAKENSSQEEIYLEMNRMNVWMEQVNESLNNKADLLSNESTSTSSRYQITADNVMFFDRLSTVNRRPSWG